MIRQSNLTNAFLCYRKYSIVDGGCCDCGYGYGIRFFIYLYRNSFSANDVGEYNLKKIPFINVLFVKIYEIMRDKSALMSDKDIEYHTNPSQN